MIHDVILGGHCQCIFVGSITPMSCDAIPQPDLIPILFSISVNV